MSSLSKSRAIVLHYTKYGDSGAVLHVVDSLSGRQSLFVRGIGTSRRSSALAAFHSLNVLDIVTVDTPHGSMATLKEYTPIFQLDGIRSDICRRTVALFVSEVIYRSLRADDGDSALFAWLVESIVRLDSYDGPTANFHLWFLVGYSIRCGFRPQDTWDGESAPIFDIPSARFIAPGPFHDSSLLFTAQESELLHRLLNCSFEEAMAIQLPSSRRLSFARKMLRYLSCHFGCTLDIRSLDVLHDIFA